MADLTTKEAVKVDLGITDTSEDAYIQSLVSSESQNFMNETYRMDFSPVATFTDYLVGNDRCEIFTNHYPIRTVTSVEVNGTTISEWDENSPDTLGYVFDDDVPLENRAKIYLRGTGNIFPKPCWSGYRGVVIVYTAGYAISEVPANIKRAISDRIAVKRGITQVQSTAQSGTTLTLGDYSQGATSGGSSSSSITSTADDSWQSVVDQYTRPQI